jgi:hypothetical protein
LKIENFQLSYFYRSCPLVLLYFHSRSTSTSGGQSAASGIFAFPQVVQR